MTIETVTGRKSGKIIENAIKNAKRRIYVVSPYISSEYAKLLLRKALNGVDVFVVTLKGKREFSTALLLLYSGKISKNDIEKVENHRKRLLKMIHASIATYIVLVVSILASILIFNDVKLASYLSFPLFVVASSVFFFGDLIDYAVILALIPIVLLYGSTRFYISSPELYIYTFFCFLAACYPILMLPPLIRISFTRGYHGILEEIGPPRKLVNLKFFEDSKTYVHSKLYIIDDVGFSGSLNLTIASIKKNIETITIYRGGDVDKIEKDFWKIWNMLSDPTVDIFYDIFPTF